MTILRRAAAAGGLAAIGLVAACGPPGAGATSGRATAPSLAERGYVMPPAVTAARREAGGGVLFSGTAAPGAKVRLASPAGAAVFAVADRSGIWRIALPGDAEVRLFGLSMPLAGRVVQAEGYLATVPGGLTAELRAGSGAVVLSRSRPAVAILAADFDDKGGAVISGLAPAGASVTLTIDGTARGGVVADVGGRFMVPLNEPLKPGDHELEASVGTARAQRTLGVSVAARPSGGPFRAGPAAGGWRIDWLTPGGGVQSTVLYSEGGL